MEPLQNASAPEPLLDWERIKKLSRLCAGCGRCARVCARGLSAADLLAEVRSRSPDWSQQAWELWVRQLGPLWPTVGLVAAFLSAFFSKEAAGGMLASAGALLNDTQSSPPAGSVRVIAAQKTAPAASPPLLLFSGCTAKRVRPQWTEKARALLKAFGHEPVDSSGFTCCGGTLYHAGQFDALRRLRQENLVFWRSAGRPRVAVFCASCFDALKRYGEDLASKEEEQVWQKCLTPLSALLVGAQAAQGGALSDDVGAPGQNMPAKDASPKEASGIAYHQPCHWGAVDPDIVFLRSIFNNLATGSSLCCGMGGILKMTNSKLSLDMAENCLRSFPAETKTILSGCSGCVLQLKGAAAKRTDVRHWLDAIEPDY